MELPADLTAVTFETFAEQWLEPLRKAALFRVGSVPREQTIEALSRRIMEFIHLNTLDSRPVTVGSINRQFGRAVTKTGTTVRDLVDDLVMAGRIELFPYAKRRAMVSSPAWANRKAYMTANAMGPDTPEFENALAAMSENII